MKKVLWKGGCIAVFAAAVAVLPAFGTGQPTRAVAAEEAATVEEVTFSHKRELPSTIRRMEAIRQAVRAASMRRDSSIRDQSLLRTEKRMRMFCQQ